MKTACIFCLVMPLFFALTSCGSLANDAATTDTSAQQTTTVPGEVNSDDHAAQTVRTSPGWNF